MLNNEQINYFSWSTHFDATVVIDNCVYPNRYNVNVTFLPKVKEIKTQNLAFEKVKKFPRDSKRLITSCTLCHSNIQKTDIECVVFSSFVLGKLRKILKK